MDTQQRKVATTADLVAAARARHQRDRVRLLDDPYACALTSPSLRRVLRFRPAAWFLANWTLRGLKPVILGLLIRARYAERAVEAAFRDGIRQYVVVGAGLDSFALRRTDRVPPLEVFEIDRPAMQEVKRERIRSAGIPSPPGLHFVPADLEQVSVMEALANSPFDPGDPAILSFLGVTYYLTPETLAESARSIADGVACLSHPVVCRLDLRVGIAGKPGLLSVGSGSLRSSPGRSAGAVVGSLGRMALRGRLGVLIATVSSSVLNGYSSIEARTTSTGKRKNP